jgi:hypothetical protein
MVLRYGGPLWFNGVSLPKRSGLRVLFPSGFPGAPSGNAAALDAGDALLSKPYRPAQLVEALHPVL